MAENGRLKNFDTIRLVAASSVIFSHAFTIVDGNEQNEPFFRLTGSILGIHGVFVFLIISGFLVTQSLKTSPSLQNFAWKRFLRIYPALAGCAIVSAFVISTFFSELPIREYLSSLYGVKYVAKVLLLLGSHPIPTIQFYDHASKGLEYSQNGSLWSIASEIHCYLILFFLALLNLVSMRIALFGLFAGSALLALSLLINFPFSEVWMNLIYTFPSFCAGVAMYFVHAKYGLSGKIAVGCVAALLVVAPTGGLLVMSPILAAYPIVYLGMSRSIYLGNATRFGDLSYGTYLYGWPVEQVIRSFAGTSLSGWGLFLMALPLAAACGVLSWHLVEKRALALKTLIGGSPKPVAVSTDGDEKAAAGNLG